MDRKKVCKKSSGKKKMMSIELKREIIEEHEQGVRVVDLSRQYGRSTSMICSVLKRKESIKSVTPAKGLTIISKLRTSLHDNMEKLLMVWVREKQLQGDTLTQTIICEKARAIYGDLLKQNPQTSIDEASEESFKASRGWFENFKKRSGIHSVVRHGEAAEDYHIKTFSDLVKPQAGYISQQVFNCDETGLFWKKMPNRTYITAEEKKKMPGHKPIKDRLTVLANASNQATCKIKPLLVYQSGNPRAFKSHKMEERDVKELTQELTTEELQELQSQQHTEVMQEIGFEESEDEVISTGEIKEILGMWERVSQFVEKKHPEKVATGRASDVFNDTCLTHFRNILRGSKKQTSLDKFFSKRPKYR